MNDINFRKSSTAAYISNQNEIEASSQKLIQDYSSSANYLSYEQDEQNRENFHIHNSRITGYSFEQELRDGIRIGVFNEDFIPSDLRVQQYSYNKLDGNRNVISYPYWDSPELKKIASLDRKVNELYKFYKDIDDIYNSDVNPLENFDYNATPTSLVHYKDWFGLDRNTDPYFFTCASHQDYLDLILSINSSPAGTIVSGSFTTVPKNPGAVTVTDIETITNDFVLIKDETEGYIAWAKIITKGTNLYSFDIMAEVGTVTSSLYVYEKLDSISNESLNNLKNALINKIKSNLEELEFYLTYSSFYEEDETVKNENSTILGNIQNVLEIIKDENFSFEDYDDVVELLSTLNPLTTRTTSLLTRLQDTTTSVFDDRWDVITNRLDKTLGTLVNLVKTEKGFELLYKALEKKQEQNDLIGRNFTVKKILLDGDSFNRVFVENIDNLQIGDDVYIISNNDAVPEIQAKIIDMVKARVPNTAITTIEVDEFGRPIQDYQFAYKIFLNKPVNSQYLITDQLRLVVDKNTQRKPVITVNTTPSSPWVADINWTTPEGMFTSVDQEGDLDLDEDKVKISIFIDENRLAVNDDLLTDFLVAGPPSPISSYYFYVSGETGSRTIETNITDTNGLLADFNILTADKTNLTINFGDGKTYYVGVKFSANAGFTETKTISSFTPFKKKVRFDNLVGATGSNPWEVSFSVTRLSTNLMETVTDLVNSIVFNYTVNNIHKSKIFATEPDTWTENVQTFTFINDIDCNYPVVASVTPVISALNVDAYEAVPSVIAEAQADKQTTSTISPITISKGNWEISFDYSTYLNTTPVVIGDISVTPVNHVIYKIGLAPEKAFLVNGGDTEVNITVSEIQSGTTTSYQYNFITPDTPGTELINLLTSENYIDMIVGFRITYDQRFYSDPVRENKITTQGKNQLPSPRFSEVRGEWSYSLTLLSHQFPSGITPPVVVTEYFFSNNPGNILNLAVSNSITVSNTAPSSVSGVNAYAVQAVNTTSDGDWFQSVPTVNSVSPGRKRITKSLEPTELLLPVFTYVKTKENGFKIILDTTAASDANTTYGVTKAKYKVEYNNGNSSVVINGEILQSNSWIVALTNIDPRFDIKASTAFDLSNNIDYCDAAEYDLVYGYLTGRYSFFIEGIRTARKQIDNINLSSGVNSPVISFEPREHGFYMKLNRNIYFAKGDAPITIKEGEGDAVFNRTTSEFFWSKNNAEPWNVINGEEIDITSGFLPSSPSNSVYIAVGGNTQYYTTHLINATENVNFPILTGNTNNFRSFVPLKKKIIQSLNPTIVSGQWSFTISFPGQSRFGADGKTIDFINITVAGAGTQTSNWDGTKFSNVVFSGVQSGIDRNINFEAVPLVADQADYTTFSYSVTRRTNPIIVSAPTFSVDVSNPRQISITIDSANNNNQYWYTIKRRSDNVVIRSSGWVTQTTYSQFGDPPPSNDGPATAPIENGTEYYVEIQYRNNNTSLYSGGGTVTSAFFRTKYRVGGNLQNNDAITYKATYERINPATNSTDYSLVTYKIKFENIFCENANSILANGVPVVTTLNGSGSYELIYNEGETIRLSLEASNSDSANYYNSITKSYVVPTNVLINSSNQVIDNLFEIANSGSNFIPFISRIKSLTSNVVDFRVTEFIVDSIINGRDLAPIITWTISYGAKVLTKTSLELLNNPNTQYYFNNNTSEFYIQAVAGNKNRIRVFVPQWYANNGTTIRCAVFSQFTQTAPELFLNTRTVIANQFYKVDSPTTITIEAKNTTEFINGSLPITSEPNFNSITIDLTDSLISNDGTNTQPNRFTVVYTEAELTAKPVITGSGNTRVCTGYSNLTTSNGGISFAGKPEVTRIFNTPVITISGLSEGSLYRFVITGSVSGQDQYKFRPVTRTRLFFTKARKGVIATNSITNNSTRNFQIAFDTKNIAKLKLNYDSLPANIFSSSGIKEVVYNHENLELLRRNSDSLIDPDLPYNDRYAELGKTYLSTEISGNISAPKVVGNVGSDTSISFNYETSNSIDISYMYRVVDNNDNNSIRILPTEWVGPTSFALSMAKIKIETTAAQIIGDVTVVGDQIRINCGNDLTKNVTIRIPVTNAGSVPLISTGTKIVVNGEEVNAVWNSPNLEISYTFDFRTSDQNITVYAINDNYLQSTTTRLSVFTNKNLLIDNDNVDGLEYSMNNLIGIDEDHYPDESDLVSSIRVRTSSLLDISQYDYTYGKFEATCTNYKRGTSLTNRSSEVATTESAGTFVFRPNATLQANASNLDREMTISIRLVAKSSSLEKYVNPTTPVSKMYTLFHKRTMTFDSNNVLLKTTDNATVEEPRSFTLPIGSQKVFKIFIAGIVSGHGGGGGRTAHRSSDSGNSNGGTGGAGQVVLFSQEWNRLQNQNYPNDLIISATMQKGMTGTYNTNGNYNGDSSEWEKSPAYIDWDQNGGDPRSTQLSFENDVIRFSRVFASGGSRGNSETNYRSNAPNGPGYYKGYISQDGNGNIQINGTVPSTGIKFWEYHSEGVGNIRELYNAVFQYSNIPILKNGTKIASTNLEWPADFKKEDPFVTIPVPNRNSYGFGGDGGFGHLGRNGNHGGPSYARVLGYYSYLEKNKWSDASTFVESFNLNANDIAETINYGSSTQNIPYFTYQVPYTVDLLITGHQKLMKNGMVLFAEGLDVSNNLVVKHQVKPGVSMAFPISTVKKVKFYYQNLWGRQGTSRTYNFNYTLETVADPDASVTLTPTTTFHNRPSIRIVTNLNSIFGSYSVYYVYDDNSESLQGNPGWTGQNTIHNGYIEPASLTGNNTNGYKLPFDRYLKKIKIVRSNKLSRVGPTATTTDINYTVRNIQDLIVDVPGNNTPTSWTLQYRIPAINPMNGNSYYTREEFFNIYSSMVANNGNRTVTSTTGITISSFSPSSGDLGSATTTPNTTYIRRVDSTAGINYHELYFMNSPSYQLLRFAYPSKWISFNNTLTISTT